MFDLEKKTLWMLLQKGDDSDFHAVGQRLLYGSLCPVVLLWIILLTKRILLLGIFAVLMIIASVTMIKNNAVQREEERLYKYQLLIVEGLLIGLLTGLVGAGGGFLIIPALVLLTGLPFKTAVGMSLFIIAINSLMGFLGDLFNYEIDWAFLVLITALAIGGILVGHRLSRFVSARRLRYSFAWFVLIIGAYMLVKELFFV